MAVVTTAGMAVDLASVGMALAIEPIGRALVVAVVVAAEFDQPGTARIVGSTFIEILDHFEGIVAELEELMVVEPYYNPD